MKEKSRASEGAATEKSAGTPTKKTATKATPTAGSSGRNRKQKAVDAGGNEAGEGPEDAETPSKKQKQDEGEDVKEEGAE